MRDPSPRAGHLPGLAMILALALGGCTSCRWGETRVLPPPLLGTWITHAPRYHGRSVEVHARSVVVAEGTHPIDRYHVEGVRSWRGPQGQIYQLRCVTDDGFHDALRLTYAAGPPPHLVIGEAPALWVQSRGP